MMYCTPNVNVEGMVGRALIAGLVAILKNESSGENVFQVIGPFTHEAIFRNSVGRLRDLMYSIA